MVASLLLLFAALYLGLCLLLFLAQRSLLYFPTPAVEHPRAVKLEMLTNDASLRVWHRPLIPAPALIYFGGNAEDVSGNFDGFVAALPGHALYLVNYRGYGGSSGSPTEANLFADALAVYDQVRQQHPRIAVVGRSLGSGVAAYLASQREVEKLVLVTPYDSIANVAQSHYPFFPARWLMKDRFDSISRVAAIAAPTLVIVAQHDRVIPPARTDALIAAFPPPQVRVEMIPNSAHNDLGPRDLYEALIGRFLNSK